MGTVRRQRGRPRPVEGRLSLLHAGRTAKATGQRGAGPGAGKPTGGAHPETCKGRPWPKWRLRVKGGRARGRGGRPGGQPRLMQGTPMAREGTLVIATC